MFLNNAALLPLKIVTILLLICLLLSGCGKTARDDAPNIIFITIDTLRADHLGCYGYDRPTSPNIDAFAEEGLLFTRCLSHAPVTSSSLASILSGYLPHETKVLDNLPLPEQVKTLPEILQDYGYTTVGVISNFVLRKNKGWDKGFDIFDDDMTRLTTVRIQPERIGEQTTQRAVELMKRYSDKRLFMWIHYQDPHGPYNPPERLSGLFGDHGQESRLLEVNDSNSGYNGIPIYQMLGEQRDYHHYVSRYDREIRYVDEQMKLLLDGMKEAGLYNDSFIVFTSDHGEGMGENDYYFAHGENLTNGLIHVPLIIKQGDKYKGQRTDYVQHLDLAPTVMNIAGISRDPLMRGFDLFAPGEPAREIFAEMESPIIKERIRLCLVKDGLKLTVTPMTNKIELYNLAEDPKEENDLSDDPEYDEQVVDLFKRLRHIYQEDLLGLNIVNEQEELTEEEKELMRQLGYVQ